MIGEREAKPSLRGATLFPLAESERGLVERRRQVAGQTDDPGRGIGLAISGGGVRSATLGLGVLQALASRGILKRFDYLSTVSGGGYVGGFWGSLFIDPRLRGSRRESAKGARTPSGVEGVLQDPCSPPVQWLRENGRYLSPNGAGDSLLAAATLVRNGISIHLILDALLLWAMLLLILARRGFESTPLAALLHSVPAPLRNPASAAAAIVLLAWVVPAGWAYWIVRSHDPKNRGLSAALLALAGVVAALTAALWRRDPWLVAWSVPFGAAFVFWGAAGGADRARERAARNRLSLWLRNGLIGILVLAGIALIDAAGFALRDLSLTRLGGGISAVAGILIAIGTALQRLVKLVSPDKQRTQIKVPVALVTQIAGLIVSAALLAGVSTIAYALVWRLTTRWIIAAWVGVLALAWLAGRGFAFLNDSSHAALYAGRLTRAYLGASNPDRESEDAMRISEVQPGDDVPWPAYKPHAFGGPLHLINLTVNETVEGRSQVEQRDRKGLGLAIGPAGASVGITHHARWTDESRLTLEPLAPAPGEFRVFEAPRSADRSSARLITPERCDLGTWMALSGAAVSTGLGSRTSRGLSTLCALLNLRLGRWWNSGVDPGWRDKAAGRRRAGNAFGQAFTTAFPVQSYFIAEMLARFFGPARRYWYLTDGGHFENTAAYELIRRRLPLIVLLDNGEDRKYEFGDLANLVRKARTDLGAEIQFLRGPELDGIDPMRQHFGSIEDIRGDRGDGDGAGPRRNHAHAALARIVYADSDDESLLVVLKPAITGREPLDVVQYAMAHADFPQDSTGDQFFDDQQWESYRRLGEFIATSVFAEAGAQVRQWDLSTLSVVQTAPQPSTAREEAAQRRSAG